MALGKQSCSPRGRSSVLSDVAIIAQRHLAFGLELKLKSQARLGPLREALRSTVLKCHVNLTCAQRKRHHWSTTK